MMLYSFVDWQQKWLYAYLLRRFIGPYLDTESVSKFYESIENVSIQDGIYILNDLRLNASYISSLLNDNKVTSPTNSTTPSVRIRNVTIHRLEIRLSLQEEEEKCNTTIANTISSLAWRAFQLGSANTDGTSAVSLVVLVLLDGLTIEIEPNDECMNRSQQKKKVTVPPNLNTTTRGSNQQTLQKQDEREEEQTTKEVEKSIFSSYIESILNSLRLSVDVQNLFVRVYSTYKPKTKQYNPSSSHDIIESWVQLNLYSCSYHDVKSTKQHQYHRPKESINTRRFDEYKTILHKTISFHDRITIIAGDRVAKTVQQQPVSFINDDSSGSALSKIKMWNGKQRNENEITPVQLVDVNVSMIAMLETSNTSSTWRNSSSVVDGPQFSSSSRHHSQIILRVVDYITGNESMQDQINTDQVENNSNHDTAKSMKYKRIQQDLVIEFDQPMNVSVDAQSLRQAHAVVTGFYMSHSSDNNNETNDENVMDKEHVQSTDDVVEIEDVQDIIDEEKAFESNVAKLDEANVNNGNNFLDLESTDWDSINAMLMKQYQEARELAEQKVVTGGILVPSIECDHRKTATVTYDTFFDATDGGEGGGFSQYVLGIQESILLAKDYTNKEVTTIDDWCHTKVRLYLKEGGFKISFQPGSIRPDEYILLTFGDLSIASSISLRSSKQSLSISHLEIDDSIARSEIDECNDGSNGSRRVVEIGTLLRFDDYSSMQQPHFASSSYDSDDDDNTSEKEVDEDGILIQSTPCISFHASNRIIVQHNPDDEVVAEVKRFNDIEVNIQPVCLSFRYSTVCKTFSLLKNISLNSNDNRPPQHLNPNDANTDVLLTKNITNFVLLCNSLVVDVHMEYPKFDLESNKCWKALFDRCGYRTEKNTYGAIGMITLPTNKRQSNIISFGLQFENFIFALQDDAEDTKESFGGKTCRLTSNTIIGYANSPDHTKRFDIIALCGRSEITSFIPISILFWQSHEYERMNDVHIDKSRNKQVREQVNRGASSVPRVFPISSFKARQDDNDDEDSDKDEHDDCNPDWVMSSKFKVESKPEVVHDKINVRSRIASAVCLNDPQEDMIRNAGSSKIVVTVYIPEIIGDLTMKELSILIHHIEFCRNAINQSTMQKEHVDVDDEYEDARLEDENSDKRCYSNAIELDVVDGSNACVSRGIAVNLECDYFAISIHGDVPASFSSSSKNKNICITKVSYCANVDRFKAHVFITDGRTCQHARVLCHEVNFLEVTNLERPVPSPSNPMDSHARLFILNERGRCHAGSYTTPLIHRSYLFSPISRTNPSILLDFVNHDTSTQSDKAEGTKLSQANVYLTVYDLTIRINYDSQWLARLQSFFPTLERLEKTGDKEIQENGTNSKVTSVTRFFLTVADCNADYCSSLMFKTKSRTIVRVGDFRISSNIVSPSSEYQAFSVSIGDLSLYFCNSRYPYNYENRQLLRCESFMRPDEIAIRELGLPHDCDPSCVLHAMNVRTMVVLDSLNATITVSRKKRTHSTLDPSVSMSMKIGELGFFACRDSFARFIATVSEVAAEMTAITDEALEALRCKTTSQQQPNRRNEESDDFFDPNPEGQSVDDETEDHTQFFSVADLTKENETSSWNPSAFLLDGYDWTTIETVKSNAFNIPDGEEQSARWYHDEKSPVESCGISDSDEIGFSSGIGPDPNDAKLRSRSVAGPRIIPHHFSLQPVSDPIADGDMGMEKYAGIGYVPQVKSRMLIHDFAIKFVIFDGYDWPELLEHETKTLTSTNDAFVIPEVQPRKTKEAKSEISEGISTQLDGNARKHLERKAKLMGDLLFNDNAVQSTFEGIPLPEERIKRSQEQAELRRLSRNAAKYIQVSVSGITLRIDSLENSNDHLLASCLNVMANDFFIAETIGSARPVKMAGEWVSEADHPRDSRDGMFMMKMVTWHPAQPLNLDSSIANDEVEATLTILPLRCMLDQRAIIFARAFFKDDDDVQGDMKTAPTFLSAGLNAIPPPLFRLFRMRSFKLKVNYTPQKIDAQALRDGSLVELVNLSPIDCMVLTLQNVDVRNEIGFGPVISIVVRRWIEDICATQIVKFLTNSRPFEPLTQVGGAAVDMVVLPWDAFNNGQSIQRALRAGSASFSRTLITEAFTVTSRVAEYLAGKLSQVVTLGTDNVIIPSRPHAPPKGMMEATPHAVASISRGLQAANYKIIIIPYREYRRSGAKGAVISVLRGIPVAVAAPASGVTEAISFGLLAARNHIRPDLRKEEESAQLNNHNGFNFGRR